MGYFSKVVVECSRNNYDKIMDLVREDEYFKPAAFGKIYRSYESDHYIIYWDWTKWYSDDFTNAVEDIANSAPCTEHNWCSLLRMGEDLTDIEIIGETYSGFESAIDIMIPDNIMEVGE